jgi:hypothetical protein
MLKCAKLKIPGTAIAIDASQNQSSLRDILHT